MEQALICLDGYRVPALLDTAAASLNSNLFWVLLHVADSRPTLEVERALHRLPGRGPGKRLAEAHMRHTTEWSIDEVRAEISSWLAGTGRVAEVVLSEGRPEREILRVAEARGINLIALGGGRGLPGRYPGPGPYPLSPLARFVIDHARGDVLLLRSYVASIDRRGG
jgi:nucleotide-binding universal stress UspA family protein